MTQSASVRFRVTATWFEQSPCPVHRGRGATNGKGDGQDGELPSGGALDAVRDCVSHVRRRARSRTRPLTWRLPFGTARGIYRASWKKAAIRAMPLAILVSSTPMYSAVVPGDECPITA